MNITEAQELWQERLSNDCEHRVASACTHDFGERQCNIKFCPILGPRAKIEKEPIYNFKDIKL